MQSNYTITSKTGPAPDEFKMTCKTGRIRMRARALHMALEKYGVHISGVGWCKVEKPAPTDVIGHLEKLNRDLETPKPPKKPYRWQCLNDSGLDITKRSPVFKIALFVLAAFERDRRAWWIYDNETVEFWNERKLSRFRALLCVLGYRDWFKFTKYRPAPTPEELYCARLLAHDLGLAGLAAYSEIFGTRADIEIDAALLYGRSARVEVA